MTPPVLSSISTLVAHEAKSPILDILMVKIVNAEGVEVETPILSPLAVLRSALSDREVFDNLQTAYFDGKIGEPACSRNMLTHPCFGPVEWELGNGVVWRDCY